MARKNNWHLAKYCNKLYFYRLWKKRGTDKFIEVRSYRDNFSKDELIRFRVYADSKIIKHPYGLVKFFKTKAQALKFAKAYMRKN